jgi:hypothetical protein
VETSREAVEFSLLGGPLHRMARRLGLVRGRTNTIALGIAIGLLCWIVLVSLSLIEGLADRVFSLSAIAAHARLLLAIPLYFLAETWLDPKIAGFLRAVVDRGVVPAPAVSRFQSQLAGVVRWNNSWLPETLCLALAVLLPSLEPPLSLTTAIGGYGSAGAAGGMSLTAGWYGIVCLTVFRFLSLRWLCRLIFWWYVLWRLAGTNLHLVPTHPDHAGGLGYLEVVHSQFVPLILALSVVQAAGFAQEIAGARMTIASIYPGFAANLVVCALLFLAPPHVFALRLKACRERGLSEYMGLAARYVNEFEQKWLFAGSVNERLLGTADLQSLADLTNSITVVRNMRLAPVSRRLLTISAAAAAIPMLPLPLLTSPVKILIERLFRTLFGL